MNTGIEVRPSFTVSQHARSKAVLNKLQNFFDCGSVRYNASDDTYKYEVRSLKDLSEKIIPHFEQFPLQTSKVDDFEALKTVCNLMTASEHLSAEGIEKIINISVSMNNLGARRYTKDDLLRVVRR